MQGGEKLALRRSRERATQRQYSDATPVYSRVQPLPSSRPERPGTLSAAGRSQGSCDSGSSGLEETSAALRRRQPAETAKAYASPSGKHESIAAWRYSPFGESHRDEVDAAQVSRQVRSLSAVWPMRRDAPRVLRGTFWGATWRTSFATGGCVAREGKNQESSC